jgi:hypothetical protein
MDFSHSGLNNNPIGNDNWYGGQEGSKPMTTLLVGTREAIPVLGSLSTCLDNSFIRCVVPQTLMVPHVQVLFAADSATKQTVHVTPKDARNNTSAGVGYMSSRPTLLNKCWNSKHYLVCCSKDVGICVGGYQTTIGTIATVAWVSGHEVRFTYGRTLCTNICVHCFIYT